MANGGHIFFLFLQNRVLLPKITQPLTSLKYGPLRNLAVQVVQAEFGGFTRRIGWGKPESKPVWWPSTVPWTTRGVQSGVTVNDMRALVRAAYAHHQQPVQDRASSPTQPPAHSSTLPPAHSPSLSPAHSPLSNASLSPHSLMSIPPLSPHQQSLLSLHDQSSLSQAPQSPVTQQSSLLSPLPYSPTSPPRCPLAPLVPYDSDSYESESGDSHVYSANIANANANAVPVGLASNNLGKVYLTPSLHDTPTIRHRTSTPREGSKGRRPSQDGFTCPESPTFELRLSLSNSGTPSGLPAFNIEPSLCIPNSGTPTGIPAHNIDPTPGPSRVLFPKKQTAVVTPLGKQVPKRKGESSCIARRVQNKRRRFNNKN